ncbi:RNA polymerase ECF family sigma subunit [Kribbella amoyensis]|uniref:RNA polymerase ECF family sigma subunit n=1 Tax=Kribbella amoyensis TaxID=996641 RepID=A0A561BMI4_9ACTN|nr:sigma-70 family RNA polymerase sigma factor [Kribbella amoyensis]TWD80100.1 RNA polymerase ECF family sigma subunit [Kribbella amoyensis]
MTQTPIRARPGPVSEAGVPDPRRERFEELFAAHREAVLGYLRRRTGNGHDAADLLADTFLVVWRRLDDVPAGDQTRPWLYGVARRALANHRRGEGRRTALADRLRSELTETTPPEPAPDTSTAGRAFRALPDADRELLSLVAWEELDSAQIATALGCSRNAVRIRLHRARKRFAKLLAASPPALARDEVSHEDA